MAETYKGLTIRIGGDATELQKALRSVTSSISATENQLRRMRQALQMDPGNTEAIETNLRLMGQRAVEAQSKLSQLRSSLKEIGGQNVELFGGARSVQTIKELADGTEDAARRAADAKRNYAEVVEQLARVKSSIKEITGIDLDDELNPDETVETMRQLGMVSDELAGKYASLRTAYADAFNENETAKAVAQFRDLEVETTKAGAEAESTARRFSEMSRAASQVKFPADVDDRLRQVDAAAEDVSAELSRVNRALELDPGNVDNIALKMRDLAEASSLAEQRSDLLQSKLEAMNAAGIGKLSDETSDVALAAQRAADEYDQATARVTEMRGELQRLASEQSLLAAKDQVGSDEYRELGDRIAECRTELTRLVAEQDRASASFDTANQVKEYRELQTEIAETRSQVNRYNDELGSMSKFSGITAGSLTSLGMSLSTSVTPAITAMGYGMVQSANDIDAAYRDMRKTVNGTEEDFESLRQAAIDFSATHVTSADQILSIQAIGGELGIATDDLKAFAETVSNIDVATDLGAEDAATALGQLSNILGDLNADKFPNFSDALVRLGNNGASTESQIANIATRIGSMASIVGMSTPEILAWSSTIASTGQGAEAAGTAISNTIRDIETAVDKGGEDLQAFADVAGMSAEEFANAWESSPSDALYAFIEGLNRIEADGGSALTTLDDLGIKAARQTQAIQGLMQMINGTDDGIVSLSDNIRMSEDAWNGVSDSWGEAGDAAREASAKAEGFSGSLSMLQNMAQNVGAELGDALVPVLDGVTDVLGDLYDWFVGLDDGTKRAIVGVGAFVAALGPLILLGKGIGEFFGSVSSGMDKLSKVGKAAKNVGQLSKAFDGLSDSLSGGLVAGGITLAVGAIGALVSEYGRWQQEQENLRKSTEGLNDVVADTTALDKYANTLDDISDGSGFTAMSVQELAESTAESVDRMRQTTEDAQEQIATLNTAQDIINRYAGQTDLTADAQGRLQWAISLVNDEFGTNISLADVANDKYTDQQGNVVDLTDSINDLIDAKKEEARVNAITSNLTEAYKDQANAADTLAQAQQDYNDRVQFFLDSVPGITRAEAEQRASTENEARALEDAKSQYDSATGAVSELEEELGAAATASSDAADAYDRLSSTMGSAKFDLFDSQLRSMGTSFSDLTDDLRTLGVDTEEFSNLSSDKLYELAQSYDGTASSIIEDLDRFGISMDEAASNTARVTDGIVDAINKLGDGHAATSLSNMGISVENLAQKMADAGLTAVDLNAVTTENFDKMVSACGGDIDTLIWMIQNYNNVPVVDKDGNVTVDDAQLRDAQGRIYTWNGSELVDQDGNVAVDDIELIDAQGRIYIWNDSSLKTQKGAFSIETSPIEKALSFIDTWNNTGLKLLSGYFDIVTRKRTVDVGTSSSSRSGRSAAAPASAMVSPAALASVPMTMSADAASAASLSPISRLASSGLSRVASTLAQDSGAFASMASEIASGPSRERVPATDRKLSRVASGGVYIENQNFDTRVVRADEDLYSVAPIIYRNATREARLMGR